MDSPIHSKSKLRPLSIQHRHQHQQQQPLVQKQKSNDSLDILQSDYDNLRQQVLSLIHQKCPKWEQWDKVSHFSELRLERISGAMSNCIYIVHGPPSLNDSCVSTSPPSHSFMKQDGRRVLLRVYGQGMDQFIHRDREIYWLRKLSDNGYGPKLLGTFSNGRFEEYLDAQPCTKLDLRQPTISKAIAKKLCQLHLQFHAFPPSPSSHATDRSEIWDVVDSYLRLAIKGIHRLTEKSIERQLQLQQLQINQWEYYISRYKQKIIAMASPIVFAHNDVQYGNVLKHTISNKLILVDFEYSSLNYRGYDLANHFLEWTADYHSSSPHVLDLSLYPTLSQRFHFYQSYLDTYYTLKPHLPYFCFPSSDPLQALDQEVQSFVPLSHLVWGLWGIVREINNNERREIDFNFWEYGIQRLSEFVKWVKDME